MSSMDYDLNEVLSVIMNALTASPDSGVAIAKCRSYQNYGGWCDEPTEDGEILAGALEALVMRLEQLLVAAGLLTPFGILRGHYNGLIGYDITFLEKE